MKYVVLLLTAVLLAPLAATAAPPITLDSLLQEMVDAESIARWPQPEFTCKQASSYDRETVAPDKPGWFANNDQNQFIRIETNRGRDREGDAGRRRAGLPRAVLADHRPQQERHAADSTWTKPRNRPWPSPPTTCSAGI